MSSNQTINPAPLQPPPITEDGPWTWFTVKIFALILFFVGCFVFAWPVAIFIVGIVLLIIAKRIEMQRRLNCWTLAIAVERGIPLSQTILSLGAESGARMRYYLRRLFCNVQSGMRFEDAICSVPQVIPRFLLPLFRIGCLSGRPHRAMQIVSSQEDTENYKIAQALLGRLLYLCLCLTAMIGIAWFILIKIIPEFKYIAADFDMEGEFFFLTLMSSVFAPFGGILTAVFSMVLLVLVGCCIYALLRLMGVVTFDLPLIGWIMRRGHRARIQESLSLAAECGMPIEDAIRELTFFYPTQSIRFRLVSAYQQIEKGLDWKKVLLHMSLLTKTEHAVVESAEATGDLAWTLRLLAEKSRRRMLYWAQWVQQLLFVAMIMMFAVMIFITAMTTFEFLIKLTYSLSLPF